MHCRSCEMSLKPFMSFGQQPIANGFIESSAIGNEYFYELEVAVCPGCGLFQLVTQPDAGMMFHKNYAFFSKSSKGMQRHFSAFADYVRQNFLTSASPFVVEIGSNDGILLQNFADWNIAHLGIEPSQNVFEEAKRNGVETLCAFFSEDTSDKVCDQYGKADAIISANVICHIPDINSVAKGIVKLLKPEGVFIFEDPYLGDVVGKTSYDQIYDEHVFLFCVGSVKNIFEKFGLTLLDVLPQTTHGGSMRYVLGRQQYHEISDNVQKQIAKETALGLSLDSTYDAFRNNCEKSRADLVKLLTELKAKKKKVVGYAATSKSTTVLNYCNIGSDLIDFISDTSPEKQNKLSPGKHIPVKSHDEFVANYPDYAVLFAWNHEAEIKSKEKRFEESGGQWVHFVPDVRIDEPIQ